MPNFMELVIVTHKMQFTYETDNHFHGGIESGSSLLLAVARVTGVEPVTIEGWDAHSGAPWKYPAACLVHVKPGTFHGDAAPFGVPAARQYIDVHRQANGVAVAQAWHDRVVLATDLQPVGVNLVALNDYDTVKEMLLAAG